MRTIIDIPEEQINHLARICKDQQISRAELIRKAINMYLKETGLTENDVAFGILKSRKIDSMQYQQKLREEWK